MILASHGLIASQIASVDADALAFFGRVTTAGGTLSATEKAAVNTLVVQMKADGTWTPMKAIYPMVGASAAACAQNLKSSSFTGSFSSGWTFASTGVNGNGTSAYFDTNCIITSDLPSTNYGVGFYKRSTNATNAGDIGRDTANLNIYSQYSPDGKTYHRGINASPDNYSQTPLNGFYHQYGKTASSTAFYNGTKKLTGGAGNTNSVGLSLCLAGLIFTPTGFNSSQYTFMFTSESLTDTQAGNFYTAVQAFQTTLARQVV
jgi:hypothetical protein